MGYINLLIRWLGSKITLKYYNYYTTNFEKIMENFVKESIKDEEMNRKKYPASRIVITVIVIGIILMVVAYLGSYISWE